MNVVVVVFPGSNCDADTLNVLSEISGMNAQYAWHGNTSIPDTDIIVLPGGFSHGDYLRSGAMAAHSPIMAAVRDHAERGRPLLGICNGFQILLESNLLPGAMLPNTSTKFCCEWTHVRVDSTKTPFSSSSKSGHVLRLPIAHGEGNYVIDDEGLARLHDNDQVVYRYTTAEGIRSPDSNPNGSLDDIAGICNVDRNIVGMMPHPERASESVLGSMDGLTVWESLLSGASA